MGVFFKRDGPHDGARLRRREAFCGQLNDERRTCILRAARLVGSGGGSGWLMLLDAAQ